MRYITATFKGKNSLGYEHGKTYKLRVWAGKKPGTLDALAFNLTIEHPILIARATTEFGYDGGGLCPYSSILTFLDNWTDIKTI